jgi:hypothetical protein
VIVEAGALAGYLWLAHRARLGINWARGLYQPTLISIPLIGLLLIGRGLPFLLLLACTLLLWAALFGLLRPWATGLAAESAPEGLVAKPAFAGSFARLTTSFQPAQAGSGEADGLSQGADSAASPPEEVNIQ